MEGQKQPLMRLIQKLNRYEFTDNTDKTNIKTKNNDFCQYCQWFLGYRTIGLNINYLL